MREPNWLMFCRSLTSVRDGSISNRISDYVHIEWNRVTCAYTEDTLLQLIPLSSRPEVGSDDVEKFRTLDPIRHYRGKHILGFFLSWLEAFSGALRDGKTSFFEEEIQQRFGRSVLTMRNLASRSELPLGLVEFIATLKT